MNKACKVCEHHTYIKKTNEFDMGMHWCKKYNDAIRDIEICEFRNFIQIKYQIMNNEVTNFMYYMFNRWNEQEAIDLYGKLLGKHIYEKWIAARRDGLLWYGALDNECRQKIVDRANEIYN